MIDPRVKDACLEFSEETKVMVNDTAQELITLIIHSILTDPHPTWPDHSPDFLQKQQDLYFGTLPEALKRIASDYELATISTFDLLFHWPAICDWICFTGFVDPIGPTSKPKSREWFRNRHQGLIEL